MSLLSPIRIKARLAGKLSNLAFRRRFFRQRSQEETAQQIREVRERRKLRQVDLAKQAGMKQSAISRIEQASYSAWTYKTFLRIAEALDCQLRIIFEASEDVIARYKSEESETAVDAPAPIWKQLEASGVQPTRAQNDQFLLDEFARQFVARTRSTQSSAESESHGIEGGITGAGNVVSTPDGYIRLFAQGGQRATS